MSHALMLAALGQHDAERARGDLGVLEEQLVEIAHPVEQQAARIGGLDLEVLLHHRRDARARPAAMPCRTPIGRYGGALAKVRTDDSRRAKTDQGGADVFVCDAHPDPASAVRSPRSTMAAAALMARHRRGLDLGCANQAGEDNRNVARMALLLAGCRNRFPA
jgi:hypothetical protein